MQFNSYIFAAFFAVVLAVYYLPIGGTARKAWLVGMSYLFYAAWDPVFVVLLWVSTFVDWTAAKVIVRARTPRRKKLLMVVSVIVNLGILGYFKYGNFVRANVVTVLHGLGIDYHPATFDIVLPIGISFYTFHTLSYTLDVYLGRTKPWPSFLDFALYVTFFPALVAGPILRASQFLPQCIRPRLATAHQLGWGLALVVLGLFEKNVIADAIMAPAVEDVFTATGPVGFFDAWTGTLAFAGQIVCDFAGYTTCAIGVALCLGFSIPDNFRFPYAAIGFSDFWQRWHISLSSWLRDYLYIPLGGNRRGPTRTHVNLMLTMLIGGLWHGASWTFVVWGSLHGAYLIVERILVRSLPEGEWRKALWAQLTAAGVTFVLVCIAWVFFRAHSFAQAFALLRSMVGFDHGARILIPTKSFPVLATMLCLLATHWMMRDTSIERLAERAPWFLRSFALALMIVSIVLMQGEDRAFIYFQF